MKRKQSESLELSVSLADGPKHGYAMTADIEALTGMRPGPGTLYGAITRLEERGLIERVDAGDRRNPYRLTGPGLSSLRARLSVLETVARIGRRRLAHA